jgi:hypothetical protein
MAAYIVVVNSAPDFETAAASEPIARAAPRLADLAEGLGVPPLEDYWHFPQVAGLLFDGGRRVEGLPHGWFAPSIGLRTVQTLAAHLETVGTTDPELQATAPDLRAFERALLDAERRGLLWHLTFRP